MKTTFENRRFVRYCLHKPISTFFIICTLLASLIAADLIIHWKESKENSGYAQNLIKRIDNLPYNITYIGIYSANPEILDATIASEADEKGITDLVRDTAKYVEMQLKFAKRIIQLSVER